MSPDFEREAWKSGDFDGKYVFGESDPGSTLAPKGEQIPDQKSADVEVYDRPIEGDWPYLWIDATYLKVRRGSRVVSVAVIIAVGVNTDGRREVPGMETGTSEAPGICDED